MSGLDKFVHVWLLHFSVKVTCILSCVVVFLQYLCMVFSLANNKSGHNLFVGTRRTTPRNPRGKTTETGGEGSQRSCSRGKTKSAGS